MACPTLLASCPGRSSSTGRHAADWAARAVRVLRQAAVCRSPVKDVPCHKHCAEAWITQHARDAGHLAQLIAAYTPARGVRGELPRHLPRAAMPRLRLRRHHRDEVETGDGLTETALTCRDCGTAWPLACVCDWTARPSTSRPEHLTRRYPPCVNHPGHGNHYLLPSTGPTARPHSRLDRGSDRLDRPPRHGARLVEVIWQAGIGFTLVRVSEGTRHTERAIKNAGGAVRYCPSCTPRPRNGHWPPCPATSSPHLPQPGRRR